MLCVPNSILSSRETRLKKKRSLTTISFTGNAHPHTSLVPGGYLFWNFSGFLCIFLSHLSPPSLKLHFVWKRWAKYPWNVLFFDAFTLKPTRTRYSHRTEKTSFLSFETKTRWKRKKLHQRLCSLRIDISAGYSLGLLHHYTTLTPRINDVFWLNVKNYWSQVEWSRFAQKQQHIRPSSLCSQTVESWSFISLSHFYLSMPTLWKDCSSCNLTFLIERHTFRDLVVIPKHLVSRHSVCLLACLLTSFLRQTACPIIHADRQCFGKHTTHTQTKSPPTYALTVLGRSFIGLRMTIKNKRKRTVFFSLDFLW